MTIHQQEFQAPRDAATAEAEIPARRPGGVREAAPPLPRPVPRPVPVAPPPRVEAPAPRPASISSAVSPSQAGKVDEVIDVRSPEAAARDKEYHQTKSAIFNAWGKVTLFSA